MALLIVGLIVLLILDLTATTSTEKDAKGVAAFRFLAEKGVGKGVVAVRFLA
jgi:hypothetical protein